MENLRPCPFCGREAKDVETWNTRAEKMCRMVRKPTIDPYTDRAVCSGCGKSVPVSVGERMPNYCSNCGAKVIANEGRKNG